jgi:GNAT superfamily N-acetyltransferase
VAELARAAIDELAPMRGGAVWKAREARAEPIEEGIEALLDDAEARVLVATIDEVVLGYAVVRLERLGDGSVLGVVDDIFVEEGARQIGLGEMMMDDLVAWCDERKCIGMDAMALPGHRATKNFFEESGFTARQLIMHHTFDR